MGLSSPPVLGGISPVPVPQDAAFPYVTCLEVRGTELESLSGRSGLIPSIMQVNCFHQDYETAFIIREAIKDLLIDFVGTTSGLTVQSSLHNLDTELYDGPQKLHQLIARFNVWWES